MSRLIKRDVSAKKIPWLQTWSPARCSCAPIAPISKAAGFYRRRAALVLPGANLPYRIASKKPRP